MLQFPVQLHNQHRFENDQQRYVVDLEVGEVLQIDEVVHSILDYCETCTFHELIERLKHRYPKQVLFEGIRKLEGIAKLGLIVSSNTREPTFRAKEVPKTQIRLFALHSLETPDPYPEDTWAFLRAMAAHVEISYGLFNSEEIPPAIQETGIHSFSIQTEGDHSLARCLASMGRTHDALLLLHADSLRTLQLFECFQMPVVARVCSEIEGTTTVGGIHGIPKIEAVINSTLAMYAAMRPFDAAVIDSPWLYQILSHLLNHPEGIHFVPLPKEVEANRLPTDPTLSDLGDLFKVNLASTPQDIDDTTWDSIAKAFVQLLTDLINNRSVHEFAPDAGLRFYQRYNPTSGEVSPQTCMFPSLLKHNMNDAIIGALRKNHTEKEIELVRETIAT